MAQALLTPLIENGDFKPDSVLAVVGQQKSVEVALEDFPKELKVVASSDPIAKEVWTAPVQLLAIKPQQLNEIKLPTINTHSSGKPLLISLLAGITLRRLQESFPKHSCVRAVPNTPVLAKAGLTGLAWGKEVTMEQKTLVRNIFTPISEVFELPEKQLDAFLALTSSGPAYVALMIEALADGAVAAGLPRQRANYLANRTLAGTALLLNEQKIHPSELREMVASPGGTTIAALRHLEMAGVRSALIEAVVVAAERSRELA